MKKLFSRVLIALLSGVLLLGVWGSNEAFAAEVLTGECGQNLTWNFEMETGTLTITGEGAIRDYDKVELTPWASYSAKIKRIVLQSGVTAIGKNAFSGCAVEKVELPDTLESIGQNAFRDCWYLSALDLTQTKVRFIAAGAFGGCKNLTQTNVKLPKTMGQAVSEIFGVRGTVEEVTEQEQQGSPAVSTETTSVEAVRTWTEEQDGRSLQFTQMPDGTVHITCYEDGELVYRSTRTYGNDGQIHEEKKYPDGSTEVEDRVEDENGNPLSSETKYYYEDGKLQRTAFTTYDKEGRVHVKCTYPDGRLLVEERVESPDGKILSLEQNVRDKDGKRLFRMVLKNEGDTTSTCYYDENDQIIREIESKLNPDGSRNETEKLCIQGTNSTSTTTIKTQRDANGDIIEKTEVTDDTFNGSGSHKETSLKRNEDGTYSMTSKREGNGETTTETGELDNNMNLVKSTSQTIGADGKMLAKEEICVNSDGTSTINNWSINKVDGKKTKTVTVRSAEDKELSYAETILDADGKRIGGKDRFLQEDGTYREIETQSNQDGSLKVFTVIRDERKEIKEQTEWSLNDNSLTETTSRYKDGGDKDDTWTTILQWNSDNIGAFSRIAIGDAGGNSLGESFGQTNPDGSVTVSIEADYGNGLTKQMKYTLVKDENTGKVKVTSVVSLRDARGNTVETITVTPNENGSTTRTVENSALKEEFVYNENGTKQSHTRTNTATGESRKTTFDENGDPHTEVYDKNNNLTGQVDTLSLDEPMAVVVGSVDQETDGEDSIGEELVEEDPIEKEPVEEEPIKEDPIKEEPIKEEVVEEQQPEEDPIQENPTEENPAGQSQSESKADDLPSDDEEIIEETA